MFKEVRQLLVQNLLSTYSKPTTSFKTLFPYSAPVLDHLAIVDFHSESSGISYLSRILSSIGFIQLLAYRDMSEWRHIWWNSDSKETIVSISKGYKRTLGLPSARKIFRPVQPWMECPSTIILRTRKISLRSVPSPTSAEYFHQCSSDLGGQVSYRLD